MPIAVARRMTEVFRVSIECYFYWLAGDAMRWTAGQGQRLPAATAVEQRAERHACAVADWYGPRPRLRGE